MTISHNDLLYSAFKLQTKFEDPFKKSIDRLGTAFFVGKNNKCYLITNRHLLDLEYEDLKYKGCKLTEIKLFGRFSGDELLDCHLPLEHNVIRFSKNNLNDVACIPEPKMILGKKEVRLDNYFSDGLLAKEEDFQKKLSVCDIIAFSGYPEWHDKDEQRPIFRVGTIASDPSRTYGGGKKGDRIAYEGFSSDGASGSPIFAFQKGLKITGGENSSDFREGMVIGINAGHFGSNQFQHSGISFFYKSSVILELLDSFHKAA